MSGVDRLLALVVVARRESTLDHAARGLDRAGCDDAFRGAALAQQHVHAGAASSGDGAGHVTVHDELHACTGVADLLHELLVAGALQHAHAHLVHGLAQGFCHQVDVLLDGQAQVHEVRGLRAHHHLLHIEHGRRVIHRAALSNREHAQRVVVAQRRQAGAVDGVDRHVHDGAGTVAHLFAVEQHGRFVLLALADHDGAVHAHSVHEGAHRVDGGAVGPVLVAEAHPAAAGDGRGFGNADELECEVAIGGGGVERLRGHRVSIIECCVWASGGRARARKDGPR